MSRYEFLRELREYLEGNLPDTDIDECIRYYERYIDEQISLGYQEVEVVGRLGDPRIIGRSVVDAAGRRNAYGQNSRSSADADYSSQKDFRSQKEDQGSKKKGDWDIKKVINIVLAIIVILVVLIAVTKVVSFFFPLIVVVVILALIVRYRDRHKS